MRAPALFLLFSACAEPAALPRAAPAPEPRAATSVATAEPAPTTSATVLPEEQARPPRRGRDPLGLRGTSPEAFVIEPDPEQPDAIAKLALFDEPFECEGVERVGSCKPEGTTRMSVGSAGFVLLRTVDGWEHDGMHGTQETVSFVSMEPSPKIVHTLTQFETDVFDCGTTVKMRRWALVKEQPSELFCMESVEENGAGLFDVMDLEEAGKPWHPLQRKRSFRAFRWDAATRSFVEDQGAVSRCPKKGYATFVAAAERSGLLERRLAEQGESKTIPCPRELFGGCMVPFCEGRASRRTDVLLLGPDTDYETSLMANETDQGPKPFTTNIEKATVENTTYRTALWTGKHLQLTVMSIEPGHDIGLEAHEATDQFLRVESGRGRVQMGPKKDELTFDREVEDDFAILVPAGSWHNVTNIGAEPLKIYSLYAPPEHPHGTVHATKAEADEAEAHHHH